MRSLAILLALGAAVVAGPLGEQAILRDFEVPLAPYSHSQGYVFEPLHHLPGISPYFDAIGFGLNHTAPLGCNVTAATYLVRHASIYCNDDEYDEYIKPFLWKLEKGRGGFSGALEFLNKWHSPIDENKLEEITPAGLEDAMQVGKHLLSRYPHLVPGTKAILADKKSRTFDTAKSFVKAFPQADEIKVVRILKDLNGSMDSLVPHKSCKAFSKEPGQKELATFIQKSMPHVADRLNVYLDSEEKFNSSDIMAMQSLCGYESAILGKRSLLCAVFTDAEWMNYEYAWDLKYAYMVGPLNELSPYLGYPWLQAQSELFAHFQHVDQTGETDEQNIESMQGWPAGQRFFLSFTHREVPPFVATALGIFNSSSDAVEQFPTDHVNWVRAWRMSDLIPFLGHVGLEKLTCERAGFDERHYVRVIANSAPRPIPFCQDGPGASCHFHKFQKLIRSGSDRYEDFHTVCDKKKKKHHN